MSNAPESAASIYDLGYQRYQGERIGRRQAIMTIYVEGLRGIFGLGRSSAAKIAPWTLIAIAMLPAVTVLAVSIIMGGDGDSGDIFEHHEYFSLVSLVLALFIAIVGPDVVGRDQRNRTISLYFSRALSRSDHVLAKYAATTTGLLLLTLLPQAVLYAGNALIVESFGDYVTDEAHLILPIIGSSLLASAFLAAIGLFIASLTPRRAFATVGIILVMIVTTVVAGIMIDLDTSALALLIYLSPFDVMDGFGRFLFDVPPDDGSTLAAAGYEPFTYAIVAVGASVVAVGLLVRHYLRLQA